MGWAVHAPGRSSIYLKWFFWLFLQPGFWKRCLKIIFSNSCCKGTDEEASLASVEPVEEGVVGKANQFKTFNPSSVRPSLVFVCCSHNCSFTGSCSSNEVSHNFFIWAVVQLERGSVSVRFWLVLNCWGQTLKREHRWCYFLFQGATESIPWCCGEWKDWRVFMQFRDGWLLWWDLCLHLKNLFVLAILWTLCCPSLIKCNPPVGGVFTSYPSNVWWCRQWIQEGY